LNRIPTTQTRVDVSAEPLRARPASRGAAPVPAFASASAANVDSLDH
jgi:hypothetical protein